MQHQPCKNQVALSAHHFGGYLKQRSATEEYSQVALSAHHYGGYLKQRSATEEYSQVALSAHHYGGYLKQKKCYRRIQSLTENHRLHEHSERAGGQRIALYEGGQ